MPWFLTLRFVDAPPLDFHANRRTLTLPASPCFVDYAKTTDRVPFFSDCSFLPGTPPTHSLSLSFDFAIVFLEQSFLDPLSRCPCTKVYCASSICNSVFETRQAKRERERESGEKEERKSKPRKVELVLIDTRKTERKR